MQATMLEARNCDAGYAVAEDSACTNDLPVTYEVLIAGHHARGAKSPQYAENKCRKLRIPACAANML